MTEIPKPIQDAKATVELAQKALEIAINEYAPEAPFKVGDRVTYREWWENNDINKKGVVAHISYSPYGSDSYNDWHIRIDPATKNWTKHNGRNPVWIRGGRNADIKLAEG